MAKLKKKQKAERIDLAISFNEAQGDLRADKLIKLFDLSCAAGEISEDSFAENLNLSTSKLRDTFENTIFEIKEYQRKDYDFQGLPAPELPKNITQEVTKTLKNLYTP